MKKQNGWYKVLLNKRIYNTENGQTITCPEICVAQSSEFLKLHERNRQTQKQHIKKMGLSVTKLSFILRQIVVVKLGNDYFVADGQHLFSWLSGQNMPIEFMLISVSNEEQLIDIMRQMNSSSKRWGLDQFANVMISNVKENSYNKLMNLFKKHELKLGMTVKVMSALMFSEIKYNEGASSRAIVNDYFVQNVSDVKINKKLKALKRFYKGTKMTPTNYLNGAFFELLYNKNDVYYKNEEKFIAKVSEDVRKRELTTYKFGNKKNAISLIENGWLKM